MWHENDNPKTADALIAAQKAIPVHIGSVASAATMPAASPAAVALAELSPVSCTYCPRTTDNSEIFAVGYPFAEDGDHLCYECLAQTLIDHHKFFNDITSLDD